MGWKYSQFLFSLIILSLQIRFSHTKEVNLVEVGDEMLQKLRDTFYGETITSFSVFDPLRFPNLTEVTNFFLSVNSTDVVGNLTVCGMKIEGQATIFDNLTLTTIVNPELSWILTIPVLKLSGFYEMHVETLRSFGFLTSFTYVGKGAFSVLLEDVEIRFVLQLESASPDMYLNVTNVNADLTFSNFELEGENNSFNGDPIDWKGLSRKIGPFYNLIRLFYKYKVADYIKDSLNDAFGNCTLGELPKAFEEAGDDLETCIDTSMMDGMTENFTKPDIYLKITYVDCLTILPQPVNLDEQSVTISVNEEPIISMATNSVAQPFYSRSIILCAMYYVFVLVFFSYE